MDPQITIKYAVEKCVDELYTTRAKLTARSYKSGLDRFTEFLQDRELPKDAPLAKLSMDHFIGFPAWLAERGYAKKGALLRNFAAKALLDWLVVNGYLQPSYAEMVRYQKACAALNKKRENRLPRMAPKGSVEAMQVAARQRDIPSPIKERDIALVEFLASTGCRIDEVARLKLKDIDLKERKAKVLGKGSKERIVFFSTEAATALANYWQARKLADKSSPAFARQDDGSQKGKKISHVTTAGLRKAIESIAKVAGLDGFHPHLFRHAFATLMLKETQNLALVQDLMGHASPASTRVYAKIDPDDLKKAHRDIWK